MGKGVKAHGERRKRCANFTGTEVEVLVKEVEKRKHLLFGELKGTQLTQAHTDRAWAAVAEKVNLVSPVVRSIRDLKSKFADLKTRTKQKANKLCREAKKTGGGQNKADKLSSSEQLLCAFIGKESIEGIQGGFDVGISTDHSYDHDHDHDHDHDYDQDHRNDNNHDHDQDHDDNHDDDRYRYYDHDRDRNYDHDHDYDYDHDHDHDNDHNYVQQPLGTDIIKPPSPFLGDLDRNIKAVSNSPYVNAHESHAATPKKKSTLKRAFLNTSKDTNLCLNNILQELQLLNGTIKRRLEIEEEKLNMKKKKLQKN